MSKAKPNHDLKEAPDFARFATSARLWTVAATGANRPSNFFGNAEFFFTPIGLIAGTILKSSRRVRSSLSLSSISEISIKICSLEGKSAKICDFLISPRTFTRTNSAFAPLSGNFSARLSGRRSRRSITKGSFPGISIFLMSPVCFKICERIKIGIILLYHILIHLLPLYILLVFLPPFFASCIFLPAQNQFHSAAFSTECRSEQKKSLLPSPGGRPD